MERRRRAGEPARAAVGGQRVRERAVVRPSGAHRGRMRAGRRLAAGLLAAGLVGGAGTSLAVTSSFLAPLSASAATHGAGFDLGKGFLGAYRHPDGTPAYCLQIRA